MSENHWTAQTTLPEDRLIRSPLISGGICMPLPRSLNRQATSGRRGFSPGGVLKQASYHWLVRQIVAARVVPVLQKDFLDPGYDTVFVIVDFDRQVAAA